LYVLGVVILVVGVGLNLLPFGHQPAGPIFNLVLGGLMVAFGAVMLFNLAQLRTRWDETLLSVSRRIFPEAWVKNRWMPDETRVRWYWLAVFALGCFTIVSALGDLH
jgi:hypothetical protein